MATDLLEREAPLAQLDAHLRHAAAGHGRLVLIGGEAGVGKTALVEAFGRQVNGATTLWTSCDALATPVPLGPVRDLAIALGLSLDQHMGDGEARDRLYRSVLAALAARQGPTVIIGEDAHWADGASLELLRFLARRIGGLTVLFVVTYRDDEIGPDHPLRLILGDLAAAPAVHRLSLPPLSEPAVAQLAAESGRDAGALYRLTGGNPFFLTEVLAVESGSIPTSVADAVLARAARLAPEARAVLDVAAVIGATIDPDLLLTVAGPVLDEAEACIARGVLRATGDELAFRHALAREAILAAIAPPRRRLLHARVLAALRDDPTTAGDLSRLVHHAEAGGDRAAVVTLATAAAEQAAALHAHREAAAHYARALHSGDHLPAAERGQLLEGRAIACYLGAQGEEAIAARLAAVSLWRQLGDRRKEGDNLRWLSRVYWFQGRGIDAEAAATAALDVLEPLPPGPELAMAYSNLAQVRMLAHDHEAALFWGDRAIALAQQLGETETLVHALANVGTARLQLEDPRGTEDLEQSLRLALAHGFIDHAMRALTNLAWDAALWWRLDEADRRLATAIGYATEHDLDGYRWYLVAIRAGVCVRRGTWDEAAQVRLVLQQPGITPLARIVALTTLGQIGARRGEPAAAALLEEALALAERNGQLMRLGPVRFARAEAALLRGDGQGAREEAEAIRDLVTTRGNRWERGELAWLLWQVGDRDIPIDDLAEPHARLLAGDFADASAAWDALGCPYEAAAALAESGDPALVRQAVETFERLGATPVQALAIRRLRALGAANLPPLRRGPRPQTRTNPAGLTQRELEVFALVGAGLRTAEIAARLFLTPKTVEHHLTAIYTKLGVRSRAEATRAAAQLGVTPAET